jgi:hypothetical protein
MMERGQCCSGVCQRRVTAALHVYAHAGTGAASTQRHAGTVCCRPLTPPPPPPPQTHTHTHTHLCTAHDDLRHHPRGSRRVGAALQQRRAPDLCSRRVLRARVLLCVCGRGGQDADRHAQVVVPPAQRSTAQHSAAQHSTAQHSTAQHSTALPPCVSTTPLVRPWAPRNTRQKRHITHVTHTSHTSRGLQSL